MSWTFCPSERLGVDVPLVRGVLALEGAAEGDFAFESIVMVTGPFRNRDERRIRDPPTICCATELTSLQSETCIIAPNLPSGEHRRTE